MRLRSGCKRSAMLRSPPEDLDQGIYYYSVRLLAPVDGRMKEAGGGGGDGRLTLYVLV